MENKDKLKIIIDQVESILKNEGFEVKRENNDLDIEDTVDVSYSERYYSGRFGSQDRNWIKITAWIMSKTENRRVAFNKDTKSVVERVVERIKELIEYKKECDEHEARKEKSFKSWSKKMLSKFGDLGKMKVSNYKGEKEFIIETSAKHYENVVVKEYYKEDKYKIKRIDKELTEKQVRRIIEIVKEGDGK